jgi:hypothetical protein
MLKKISLVVVVLFSVVMLNSCSKESVTLGKIDGTWKVTSASINGTNIPLGTDIVKLTFNKCKEKDALCSGSYFDSGDVDAFSYSISEDGTMVTLDPGTVDELTWKIEEITKTNLKLSLTDGTDILIYNLVKE